MDKQRSVRQGWQRDPEDRHGWKIIVLIALLIMTSIIHDPCNERNQPQSTRDAALCE